jgi:hypothetical protein
VPSQTSHAIRLDGRDIKYTTTAGTRPIRLDDGKVSARMFFVAHTKYDYDADRVGSALVKIKWSHDRNGGLPHEGSSPSQAT